MPGHAAAPFDFEYSSYGTGKEVWLPVAYTASLVALELGLVAGIWLGSEGGSDMTLAAQAFAVILAIGAVAGILPAAWKQEHSKYLYAPLVSLTSSAFMWYSSGDPEAAFPAMMVCALLLLGYMGYAVHAFFKGDDLGNVERGDARKYALSCAWSIAVVAAQAIAGFPLGLGAALVCSAGIALGTVCFIPDGGGKRRPIALWPAALKFVVFAGLFAIYATAAFSGGPAFDVDAAFYFSAALCLVAFAASAVATSRGKPYALDAALFGITAILFFFNACSDASLLAGMYAILLASMSALEAGKAAFLVQEIEAETEEPAGDAQPNEAEKENVMGWRSATNAAEEAAKETRSEVGAEEEACDEEPAEEPSAKPESPFPYPSKEMAPFWTLVGMTVAVLGIVLFANPPVPDAFPAFLPALLVIAGCAITAFGASRPFFVDDEEEEQRAAFAEDGVPRNGIANNVKEPLEEDSEEVAGNDAESVDGEVDAKEDKGVGDEQADVLEGERSRLVVAELVVLAAFAVCAIIANPWGLGALCILLAVASAIPFAAACFSDEISPIESVLFATSGLSLALIAGDGIAANPEMGLQIFVETIALLAALSLVFNAVGQCLRDCDAAKDEDVEDGVVEGTAAGAVEEDEFEEADGVVGEGAPEVAGEPEPGIDPKDARFLEICDGVVRVSVAAAAGLALLSMLGCASGIPELVSAIFQICLPAMFALAMLALAVSAFQAAQKAKRAEWDEGRCADGGNDGESSADSPVEEVPGDGDVEGGGEEPSDARQDGNGFRMLSILGTCSAGVSCIGAACLLMDGPSVASISMLVLGAAASFISFASFPGFDVAPAEEACPDEAEGAPTEPIAVRDWLEDLAETDSDERGLFQKAVVQHDAATARCDFVLPLAEGDEDARKAALAIEERILVNCRIVADSSYVDAAGEPSFYEDAGVEALLDANDELLAQLKEIGQKLVRNHVSRALEESGAVKEEASRVAGKIGKYGF